MTFNSHAGKILGREIPMTREKKGIFLSHVRVWYPFPNLGNSPKKKHNENPETTHFIHKLGITNITSDSDE